jgi:hypothetical protein
MRISIVAVSIAAFLAGCATPTPAERAAQQAQEADRMLVVYGPACEKLGFQHNTDPWRNCVIGMSQKEAIDRYSNNAFYGPPYYSPLFYRPLYYGPPFFHQPYWVR